MKRKLLLLAAFVASALGMRADDVYKDITTGKITNPSFETADETVAETNANNGDGEITVGWKIKSISFCRVAIFNSSSTPSYNLYGQSSASNSSTYYLMIRGHEQTPNTTRTTSIQQKSAFELTKSRYRISFDYKVAHNTSATSLKLTVSAFEGSSSLSNVAIDIPQVETNPSYFNGQNWSTGSFNLTLTDTKNITLDITCQTRSKSDKSMSTFALLDNFKLEWNLTQSLKDLITEANTFLTDEGDSEGTSYTALKSAITAADNVKNSDNATTLETQYNALAAALDLAKNHRKPWLAAKTTAEAAIANTTDYGNVTGEEKTNLQSAIAAAEPSDADGYDTAKSDLETKTSTFTGAKANYDAFVTAKNAVTPDLAYATTAKKTAVNDAKGAAAATSASDADEKTAAIATALRAYYESHAAAENVATASDQTSRITDAKDPSNTNKWTKTNTTGNINLRTMSDQPYTDADGTNSHSYFDSNSWNNAFTSTISQDVSLPAGTYLLTVKARGNEVTSYKVIANYEETVNETNIPSTGNTGGVYGNGWNDYSVEFTLTANKTVKIGVYVESGSSSKWISFGDFRLVKLDATYANSDDYDALDAAISTVEGSLGFDVGEYAPYNVASALAAAKAFNPAEDNIQSEVQDATAALEALTTNVSEVNAVNNGNFSEDFASSGWTRSSDWGTCISVSGDYTTAYRNYQGYLKYGDTGYYTMPLKANTYYTLETAYRSHQTISYTLRVTASVKKGEEGLSDTPNWPWTSSTSTWSKPSATFKTGSAGNYILKLQNTADTQITGVSLRRATVAEVKAILNTELEAANTLYNSGANVGTGVFQIPTASGDAFSSAIETAQGVYDNGSATVDEVADAIADLQAAKTTYANATLNAPDSEKRYYLTVVRAGKAWDGNAITFMEGAANPTQGNYGIKYLTSANANMCQAVKFTNTTGNKYKVSFLTRTGAEQYITTSNLGYSAGTDNINKERIRTVDDASKALEIEIQATTTANQFRLYNTDRGAVIADNDNNDVFTNNSANFTIVEASQASVTASAKAGKFGTIIYPFTPDISTGFDEITFYSCAEVNNGALVLSEVATPAANTPYLIKNTGGSNFSNIQSGWGTAADVNKKVGLLTGIYTQQEISANNYVLQTQGGVQGFYKLGDALEANKSVPNRAYLTVSSQVKAFYLDFDDTTGIDSVNGAIEGLLEGNVYDLSGRLVKNPTRGIYIVNGKKVLIK